MVNFTGPEGEQYTYEETIEWLRSQCRWDTNILPNDIADQLVGMIKHFPSPDNIQVQLSNLPQDIPDAMRQTWLHGFHVGLSSAAMLVEVIRDRNDGPEFPTAYEQGDGDQDE